MEAHTLNASTLTVAPIHPFLRPSKMSKVKDIRDVLNAMRMRSHAMQSSISPCSETFSRVSFMYCTLHIALQQPQCKIDNSKHASQSNVWKPSRADSNGRMQQVVPRIGSAVGSKSALETQPSLQGSLRASWPATLSRLHLEERPQSRVSRSSSKLTCLFREGTNLYSEISVL